MDADGNRPEDAPRHHVPPGDDAVAPLGGGDDPADVVERAATWAGIALTDEMRGQLERYAVWLVAEAIPAGGLGPDEHGRIRHRHLADALLFAEPWHRSRSITTLVDVGSGVGLPGIPLAIVHPDVAVTLLDRAGRRSDLADRAVRVLGLPNVEVRRTDLSRTTDTWHVATMRAVLPLPEAIVSLGRLVAPGGIGVYGGSRRQAPPDAAALAALAKRAESRDDGGEPRWELATVSIAPDVLDSPGWLLTIRT